MPFHTTLCKNASGFCDLYLEPLAAASCEPVPGLHGGSADELRLIADNGVELLVFVFHHWEEIEAVAALVSPVDIFIWYLDNAGVLVA